MQFNVSTPSCFSAIKSWKRTCVLPGLLKLPSNLTYWSNMPFMTAAGLSLSWWISADGMLAWTDRRRIYRYRPRPAWVLSKFMKPQPLEASNVWSRSLSGGKKGWLGDMRAYACQTPSKHLRFLALVLAFNSGKMSSRLRRLGNPRSPQ